jgi:hypothetical protein
MQMLKMYNHLESKTWFKKDIFREPTEELEEAEDNWIAEQ